MTVTPHMPGRTDISTGQRMFARIDGRDIAIFNVDGDIYAIDDSCPHSGASLFRGTLDGYMLKCPAHGLSFDIRSGCMKYGAGMAVRTYASKLVDGEIVFDFPEIKNAEKPA
ncbi:3-phenylpropionate/trans-cinnamate dioxygenase ferredoxin subunit [Collimonas sp. OK307]|uniref:Rieske (2Fe-2S) protein n=1 Tax=Collimonas sp. OK307 TaxID=1801620 RepID=UPI0008EE0DB5|nr:Rieske 2Fe-2S domain-containing protein [Collimonas sp. OK307]SFH94076.1 3-phenylpropionate/trans-cinnamate dioxygenase ferredoxin subunit [Collimonas sp. OK307]